MQFLIVIPCQFSSNLRSAKIEAKYSTDNVGVVCVKVHVTYGTPVALVIYFYSSRSTTRSTNQSNLIMDWKSKYM